MIIFITFIIILIILKKSLLQVGQTCNVTIRKKLLWSMKSPRNLVSHTPGTLGDPRSKPVGERKGQASKYNTAGIYLLEKLVIGNTERKKEKQKEEKKEKQIIPH